MYQFPMEVSFPKLGISFDIDNIAISIGDFSIYWYAVLILTGFVLAVLYAFKRAKHFSLVPDDMLDVIIVGLVCSIIGARAYYVIFYAENFNGFWDMINIRDGGLAIYGGVIGAFLAGWITCRIKKMNTFAMFDVGGIGFLIGQCLGRWGNFVNQEAFGSETSLPWGMVSANTGGVPVHPCFL
ncbi:MAG: prolipoprotein diacylglyceryl transferase, partial [Clostridia bacterium]|nr:prolipoprotein diacylglyceryl transferase [Clostridia bacterium]